MNWRSARRELVIASSPTASSELMVRVFEKPLHPGWVYPCTVEEIEQQLLTFPPEDLARLAVVCLVPTTRKELKDSGLYGGYYRRRATIHLYGWPDSFSYKFPQRTKRHHLAHLGVNCSFGMEVEQIGTRWYCRWEREDWHRFVLEHVLPHEIGHHVGWVREGDLSEQYADDYALRYLRTLNGGTDGATSRRRELGSHAGPPTSTGSRTGGESAMMETKHRLLLTTPAAQEGG